MHRQSFELFADYYQFYLWDETISPDAPTEWDEVDVERRIKVAPHVVVVCPIRNMTVPVVIEIHDSEPSHDESQWDHIAECSLDLPSGKLQIHECTGGSVARFLVSPGTYRVRAFYGALGTLRNNDLDGDDHYRIVLWPGTSVELKVIKQFP
jgi:hypothetical protein